LVDVDRLAPPCPRGAHRDLNSHQKEHRTMTTWIPADLGAINRNAELYVSPVRDHGVTYEDEHPGISAVPIMQGDGPKSAAVVTTPR
jgi:hypothetical protein